MPFLNPFRKRQQQQQQKQPQEQPGPGQERQQHVFVTLLHRGKLSLGEHRTRLGSEAYHWGVFIGRAADDDDDDDDSAAGLGRGVHIDVTNSVQPYADRPDLLNPEASWHFRRRPLSPATDESRLLCMMGIGVLAPPGTGTSSRPAGRVDGLAEALRQLPRPDRHTAGQHCVWWTLNAVAFMQSTGWVDVNADVDLSHLEAAATSLADGTLRDLQSKEQPVALPRVLFYHKNDRNRVRVQKDPT